VPKIAEAIPVVHDADYFVVIGTSLVVYPAAGLVHYIKPGTPTFVIDKKIPYISSSANITVIEKAATEGIIDLKRYLLETLS
jgi:NAD-dependent deacetylase